MARWISIRTGRSTTQGSVPELASFGLVSSMAAVLKSRLTLFLTL